MKKYIKIPIEVEAVQLRKDNILEVYKAVYGEEPDLSSRIASDRWDDYEDIVKEKGMRMKTLESGDGDQIASIGDFIVFGYSEKHGRHCWPVKPDYFKKAYKEVHK